MKDKEKKEKLHFLILGIRIVVSLTLALLGFFLFNEGSYELWVNLIFMVTAYLIISYDLYIEMVEEMKEGHIFNEATLMIVASLGAFSLRFFGKEHNEFLEAYLVILLFQVGEVFQDLAEDKSRKAILKSIDLREELASVSSGEEIIRRKPEEVHVGDIVIVSTGEKVLCDGRVIDGNAEIDESSLSGESALIAKQNGDPVYSGTLLSSGSIKVEVTKEYSDSTVAKLMEAIEEGANGKSRSEKFIRRFSKWYTPIVMLIALFVAVLPPLFLGANQAQNWSKWIYVSLSFLVVSCPCAIVISVPLAYFSGLGLASKNGILVKGAVYFDALNSLKAVYSDKTGTITEGKPTISGLRVFGVSEVELEQTLTLIECRSHHPLAESLYRSFNRPNIDFESYDEIPGYGIKASFEGHTYLAGRKNLLEKENVVIKGEEKGTAIYIAKDGEHIGNALFVDKAKRHSAHLVSYLHEKDITVSLLSGDAEDSVKDIATSLQMDSYRSSLLPEEKIAALKEEKARINGTIAYLGDGINDAPSLAFSDVGVAMGGLGSDLSVMNADCVILNDDPLAFRKLHKIAKATRNRAIFNIVFSLTVKFVIVFLAILSTVMGSWELPLWVSVAGDSGLALLAIISSLLLQFKKID